MQHNKEYKISINARILELLGPNLYTNIYYVLAELIANAYDASARNVYIILHADEIIIEDDGNGMSYGEINEKYLQVAKETRISNDDTYTQDELHRRKMGRKGIGKIAALSVSEKVYVKTIHNGDKSGFILSRNIPDSQKLQAINENDINFNYIKTHGTAIEMKNPTYKMNRTPDTIKKNLLKIFPFVSETFKIHIIGDRKKITLDDFDKEIIEELGGIILIGDEFKYLQQFFTNNFEGQPNSDKLYREIEVISKNIDLADKYGKKQTHKLEIKGWIGVYRSVNRKNNNADFPNNFISLFANSKLGEFNILPIITKNSLNETYIVGQLHIDLFEETTLPDMALSNRQGYKTNDPRYECVKSEAGNLLEMAINMRTLYAKLNKNKSNKIKLEKLKEKENQLKQEVEKYRKETSNKIVTNIKETLIDIPIEAIQKVKNIVKTETEEFEKIIGIKQNIDKIKKKILISQTSADKPLADIICSMLKFNNVPLEDILYTNNDEIITHIPNDEKVYDYLQKFFVDSMSSQKIYVVYVTSENMAKSWGCVMEAGAGWITKSDYCIFNINDYIPQEPLYDGKEWHTSKMDSEGNISMDNRGKNVFIDRILKICMNLGYAGKSQSSNLIEINRLLR